MAMMADSPRSIARARAAEPSTIIREAAVCRYRLGDLTADEVCRAFKIHRSTLYRWDREFAAKMN